MMFFPKYLLSSAAAITSAWNWTDPNPLSAHRYWRLSMTATFSTGVCTITELYFRNSAGTTLTGTWSTNDAGNGAASSVADGNTGTFWGSGAAPSTGSPLFLTLDLGAGNSAVVDTIDLTARTSFQSQMVRDFVLQYSDDNSTWSNATSCTWTPAYASGERRVMRVRPYILQWYWDDPMNGSFTTISELEALSATVDQTQPATTGVDYAGAMFGITGDGSYANNAFNNVFGSDYTGNAGNPAWTEYRFWGSTPVFDSVSVSARNSFSSQAPHSFKLRSSRDGLTYHNAYQAAAQAGWGSGEKRIFTTPA